MKTAFKISILLNLLLLACLWFITGKLRTPETVPSQPAALPVAAPVSAPEPVKPFRWSQLESTNYPAYIHNLRDIGCPEQTVRDIVTADVENLYRGRAERLRQDWAAGNGNASTTLPAELKKLAEEEASVLVRLLGADGALLAIHADVSVPAEQNSSSCSLPLVWQNIDMAKLNLDKEQIEAITRLRQSFMDKIGGPNQDPGSPEYRARWQNAQPEIDQALAGLVGQKAFMEYEVLVPHSGSQ